MLKICNIIGHWYKITPTEQKGIDRVECRLCGEKDIRITFISHDPARRNEKPKDITKGLIRIIKEADKRCFPDKQE